MGKGVTNYLVHKISNGKTKPNLKEILSERGFDIIVNIPTGTREKREQTDGTLIRKRAVETHTPLYTDVGVAEHIIESLYRQKFGSPLD